MKRKLVAMTAMLLCLTLVVLAQLPSNQQQPGSKPDDQDRIEAAHSQLLSTQDKAAEASRLTQSVASVLSNAADSSAPIARKNFVDELILGRMERDKIPHAPLAGDEEFLR